MGEDYPRMDSISFLIKHKYYQTTNTITVEKVKPQKRSIISIQPQVTGGYDIINKNWGITVGIGVGINI